MAEESNIIKVSVKRGYASFVYQSKEVLKTHETVALHGLGEATANVVRAAEMLCSNGYTTLENFQTLSVPETDREGISRNRNKAIITLRRSSNFDQICEEFEKTRKPK
ncbi:unnamed protein product [Blepharisma stoltei]|uniref:DNA/RNA-binding protein Alba-like domain-containing protein n=1 Tax=Blepharisma stoltei TaxID=1481888 RepID=A0AAU9JQV5_9CILI|nr:unnamed protein product [Blepharisma stoltei]